MICGFSGGSVVKSMPANAGDIRGAGSIPGSARSPRRGQGNPLLHSCLENPQTQEPGGLQSIGSKRVRHDLASKSTIHNIEVTILTIFKCAA